MALSDLVIAMSGRRDGKSRMVEILKSRAPSLIGRSISLIAMDELFNPVLSMPRAAPEFSFKNERYPAANVDIYQIRGERHDPRNPNPKAGPRIFYIIKVGDRAVGGEYASLAIAKAIAKPMHDRLIKGLVDDQRKLTPHFGRF